MPDRKKYAIATTSGAWNSPLVLDALGAANDSPVLVNRLAETTSHRDRAAIDRSVVQLVFDFLSARSVTLYHFAKDDRGELRAVRRASLGEADAARVVTDVDHQPSRLLPALDSDPLWRQVQLSGELAASEDRLLDAYRYVFPLADPRQAVIGALDVSLGALLPPREVMMVQGVLRILRNQLALLDYGERDTLTGLLNRKTFEHRFLKLTQGLQARQPAVAGAAEAESWLGLIDIDHFKSINDQCGHLFGDEVLLLVSQIMKKTFRGGDQLFRFGGEEFVVALERVDAHGARTAFDRLRRAVRMFRFPHGKAVTITLGYTRVLPSDIVFTTCVERADAALYYGKQHGRDGVHEFESLASAGVLAIAPAGGDIALF